jgi:hypothetical protein
MSSAPEPQQERHIDPETALLSSMLILTIITITLIITTSLIQKEKRNRERRTQVSLASLVIYY